MSAAPTARSPGNPPAEAASPVRESEPARGRAARFRTGLLVAVAYTAASAAIHHRVLPDLTTRASGWVSSDSSLFVWWLQWGARALATGTNPLFTTWQNAPTGVNAMWNTSVPVLGTVLAPVTALAGPVAAFNVALVLGPVVSGFVCWWALGVLPLPWWSRAVGGGLYAFSPFALAHLSVGHLNLVWAILPPTLLWAGVRVLVLRRHPGRTGAVLGLALAVQTGLYTQTVALGAVALLVGVVVLAVRWPHLVRSRIPSAARAGATSLGVYLVLCAYPLWLVVLGPGRPRGPVRDASSTGADAANVLVPTALTWLRWGGSTLAGSLRSYPGEQGSYLGAALVVVVLLTVWWSRDAWPRVLATITAVLGVLSLGTSLVVLGRDTGLPLPWRVVTGVPLVGEAEPGRLAPFVALGVAALVSIALARAAGSTRLAPTARVALVALVVLGALTWLPSDSQQSTSAVSPPFFLAGAPGLRPGETVEVVPRPSGRWVGGADPLLWQAQSDFAFRQTGGYFIGTDPQRPVALEGEVSDFQRGVAGEPVDPVRARDGLRRLGVSAVVVVPTPEVDVARASAWAQAVTGDRGTVVDTDGVRLFRL